MTLSRAALAAAAMVVAAAGCGGGGETDGGSPTTTAAPTSAPTTEAEVFEPEQAGGDGSEDPGGFVDAAASSITPLPPGGEEIEGFDPVTDATGQLSMDVPEGWTDRRDETDERPGPYVAATTSFDDLETTWDAPGAVLYTTTLQVDSSRAAFEEFNDQEVGTDLGNVILDYCELAYDQSYEREDAELTVAYYDDCDGTTTDYVIAWLAPAVGPIVALDMQLVTAADNAALTRALETFTFEQRTF